MTAKTVRIVTADDDPQLLRLIARLLAYLAQNVGRLLTQDLFAGTCLGLRLHWGKSYAPGQYQSTTAQVFHHCSYSTLFHHPKMLVISRSHVFPTDAIERFLSTEIRL